jgi:hypothetical protein
MQTAETDARSVATIGTARPAPVVAGPSRQRYRSPSR